MNSKHSKYQENHTYINHNKASENEDKDYLESSQMKRHIYLPNAWHREGPAKICV